MPKINILILEDDPLIADMLSMAVEELGAHVVAQLDRVSDALRLIETAPLDGAVIDAQLLDKDATPVALLLTERRLPFVVYTGSGLPAELAAIYPDTPVALKPSSVHRTVNSVILRVNAQRVN